MKSPWIQGLRSVALDMPDLEAAETFYTAVWRLDVAARTPGVLYLRGSGGDHHLLALHQHDGTPRVRQVTLRSRDAASLDAIAEAVLPAGGRIESRGPSADPSGGTSLTVLDADGRRFEVVHGDTRRVTDEPPPPDQPIRLAHAVLNSHAVDETCDFMRHAFGFVLADRTRIMAFMNCDLDHHSIAIGITDNDALNHIAFLMPDVDAVMRGGGRMKDAGHAIEWGPGRHGPGNNAFNYFIDPWGVVIEYTADVQQIDDSHRARGPADWTWPPGRVDQWGIAAPPSARLKAAQRVVPFSPTL